MADFALLGCHTKPEDADVEMTHLVDVYEEVLDTWSLEVSGLLHLVKKFVGKESYVL